MVVDEEGARLVKEFESKRQQYGSFAEEVERLLRRLLRDSDITYHLTKSRVKEIDSLERKISRKPKKYVTLSDITDLAGARVICYLADDVESVVEIVESNFQIDKERSVDKREAEEADRFGYSSIHYVVSLTEERCRLPDFAQYQGLKVEIQIRTVLQHAWAEIEHGLGYKSPIEIPYLLRRKLSTLAALLELADDEFVRLRHEVEELLKKVEEEIQTAPREVTIDGVSLGRFYETSETIRDIDNVVASNMGGTVDPDYSYVPGDIDILAYLDLETIEDLQRQLETHRQQIALCSQYLSGQPRESEEKVRRGISIFYLSIWLVGRQADSSEIMRFIEAVPVRFAGGTEDAAMKILDVCNRIKEEFEYAEDGR